MNNNLTSPDGSAASRFAFGTMQFGGRAGARQSHEMFDACIEAGINHFDTALLYTDGAAETLLGKMIGERRDALIIATKAAYEPPASRDALFASVETSRQRLGIDTLDVLYLHRFDPDTPLEESMAALAELRGLGRIRYAGLSNFAAWQVVHAQHIAARHELPISVIQPMYNLVKRQAEVEILPMAQALGIDVAPYSPLGGGLLTGKYGRGEDGRLKQDARYAARYADTALYDAAIKLQKIARESGHHPATLAVAWVAAHEAVPMPIISARDIDQLAPSLAAMQMQLPPDLLVELNALMPPPPPATDRSEEVG